MARRKSLLLLSVLFLVKIAAALEWWEDASLYQIYPRSFKDSTGNGVGDLNGITEKLEYLKEIGITGTWLSPIFKSPMSDFGYDVSNFFEVDPIFGTMADFDALMAKAKKLGIKIILDFVPNHSSDEAQWFIDSVNRKKGFEDFYVWDDGRVDPQDPSKRLPPCNWLSVFGGPAWTWHPKRKQFYLHQFQAKQPDFNFNNPKVRAAMFDILKFWLDRGVDGFRIDAVPHIFETQPTNGVWPDEPKSGWTEDPNEWDYLDHIHTKNHKDIPALMYEWREFLEDYQKKNGGEARILLAEAQSAISVIDEYIGNGTHNGAHIPFNFQFFVLNENSNAHEVTATVNKWMDVIWPKHKTANWLMGNHDFDRIAARCGQHKVDLFNIIMAALPGVTITYYGEEIGMNNVHTECTEVSCDFRDGERTPMQWNDDVSAGFSTNKLPWLPVADDYKLVNVKRQRGIARSSLNVYKGIKALKSTPAFKAFKANTESVRYGALNEQIFYIWRFVQNEAYLVLVNLGNKIETHKFDSSFFPKPEFKNLKYALATDRSPRRVGESETLDSIKLFPFEAVVLRA